VARHSATKGEIRLADLTSVIGLLQGNTEKEVLAFAFEAMDKDDSGYVSFQEVHMFTAALLHSSGHHGRASSTKHMVQRMWAAVGKVDYAVSLDMDEFIRAAHFAHDDLDHSLVTMLRQLGKAIKSGIETAAASPKHGPNGTPAESPAISPDALAKIKSLGGDSLDLGSPAIPLENEDEEGAASGAAAGDDSEEPSNIPIMMRSASEPI